MTAASPESPPPLKRRLPGPLLAALLCLMFLTVVVSDLDIFFRGWELKTQIQTVDPTAATFDLLALGLNDHGPPLPRKKSAEEFRILVFGDSFALSVTAPKHSFSAVMERDLNTVSKRPVRVVNLGMGGATIPAFAGLFEYWDAILEYDAVLFTIYPAADFTINLAPPHSDKWLKEKGLQTGTGVFLPRQYPYRLLDYAVNMIDVWRHLRPANEDYNSSYQMDPGDFALYMSRATRVYAADKLAIFQPSFAETQRFVSLVKAIADRGVKVAVGVFAPQVLFLPDLARTASALVGLTPQDLDPVQPLYLLTQMGARLGLDPGVFIDLYPCLAGHAGRGEDLFYGGDIHLNIAGNRAAGDYLSQVLAGRWLGLSPQPPFTGCPVPQETDKPTAKTAAAVKAALDKLPPEDPFAKR